jgi:magnesium-transporting ATPase (P-type)
MIPRSTPSTLLFSSPWLKDSALQAPGLPITQCVHRTSFSPLFFFFFQVIGQRFCLTNPATWKTYVVYPALSGTRVFFNVLVGTFPVATLTAFTENKPLVPKFDIKRYQMSALHDNNKWRSNQFISFMLTSVREALARARDIGERR